MRIRRRKRNSYGDSSASSDIAFLLIIYFIVIAGFNINKGFLMNLPAKNSTRLILKDDLMRFDMNSSGDILYQGGVQGLQEAENLISAAVSSHPNLAVVLSIDPLSPWQRIVSFVELAQKLEINSFSFNMKGDS
ncbi:MAG: biopolymer transporter ExbD [Treponema sp.]|jgi:biopolymer transport protein ExbD|nr:biopolymer transporter ExbD [Treponema sp.]